MKWILSISLDMERILFHFKLGYNYEAHVLS